MTGRVLRRRASGLLAPVYLPFVLATLGFQLRTDAGRDLTARLMGDPASDGSGSYAPACWLGLTANSAAVAAGDTSLTGEISTGTLDRAQATYGHTNGTAVYTLTHTFISDQTVTIAKVGVFNATSGGTLVFTSLLDDVAPLVSGDQLLITVTVNL
jgi:hypothetical protein